MAETFPRWNLKPIDFVHTDSAQIESEIITRYEELSGRTLADGDPIRLFLLSIASIIIQQREAINISAQQNLLSYAQGEHLDALGLLLDVQRLPASKASTTILFTLSQMLGTPFVIPRGFEITNGTVTFATDREIIIEPGNLTATATAICTEAGKIGNNFLAGQIGTIVAPMTFLKSAVNTNTSAGGSDVESDDSYVERIRLAPNRFSVAGPKKAYEFHAYSVSPAIIDVSISSPTPGTVKVYPLLEGGTMPNADVLDQVEAYLSSDTIRPLTDEVEALAPTAYDYSINVDYWINARDVQKSSTIQEAVTEAVENYKLWQQGKIGRDITPDQLILNVLRAGADRVDLTTISPSAFVQLDDTQVAQCTSITVTYKGTKTD